MEAFPNTIHGNKSTAKRVRKASINNVILGAATVITVLSPSWRGFQNELKHWLWVLLAAQFCLHMMQFHIYERIFLNSRGLVVLDCFWIMKYAICGRTFRLAFILSKPLFVSFILYTMWINVVIQIKTVWQEGFVHNLLHTVDVVE